LNTTELFAEQVLAGLLVILIAGLVYFYPLSLEYQQHLASKDYLEQIIAGGFILSAAYFLGVVYDRVADTLLQDLESSCRIHFALKSLASGESFTAPSSDPFEDGKYRILVLANQQATEHMEYLRSRIRLTRALATAIPGIMLALLLAMDYGRASRWWGRVALAIPVTYLGTLLLKGVKWKRFFERPPKTYQLDELERYMRRARMLGESSQRPRHILWLLLHDEVWFGLGTLLVASSALILSTRSYSRFWVVLVGLILTFIVGWTWWRISITFYAFLRNYKDYGVS
jgi:hypothetical protein